MPVKPTSELIRRTREIGVRVVLIRRGRRFSTGHRQVFFIRTQDNAHYQSHLSLDHLDDLLDVDLTPLVEGGAVADTEPRSNPLFLVCTHGRHDACCSIKGNQVSRVACSTPEHEAWECSHIGGDRFAANVVCFPHGLYYGRVAPEDAVPLMDDYATGWLSLEHFRGRCTHPFPVQAAEYFARRETKTNRLDDLSVVGLARTKGGRAVDFALPGSRTARVEVGVSKEGAFRLTCSARTDDPIPRYDLLSLTVSG